MKILLLTFLLLIAKSTAIIDFHEISINSDISAITYLDNCNLVALCTTNFSAITFYFE